MTHFERLQQRLGYSFSDGKILVQSLTHKSFGHEFHQNVPLAFRDNERLEFLGDAILDLVISDLLLEGFPNATEGQLTRMRASIVNEKTLADVSRSLRLSECLQLGKGEMLTGGGEKDSILSGAFEAIVAAIYLDGGYHAIYPVLRHLFSSFFTEEPSIAIASDYKTLLQEWMQSKHKTTPFYALIKTVGPDHAKSFQVEVRLKDQVLAESTGSSKKEAEQNAARIALDQVDRS